MKSSLRTDRGALLQRPSRDALKRLRSRFDGHWDALPHRAALQFGLLLLVFSLLFDIYGFAVTGEIAARHFESHFVEGLLLASFAGGTLYFVLHFLLGLTRDAEARAQCDHNRFRAVFEHCMDAIMITVPGEGIVAANRAAEELFGLSEAQLRRRPPTAFTDRGDPALQGFYRQRRETGSARGILQFRRGNGSTFPADVASKLYFETEGEPRAATLIRDISGEQANLAALAASEARYHSVFEHSMDAVLITLPEIGGVESANAAAQALFGMSEEEIIRRGRQGLVDQTDPRLPRFVKKRSLSGRLQSDLRLIRADGTTFEAVVSSAYFRNGTGEIRSVMHVRDVSDERQREARLAASESRHRALFEHSLDALVLSTPDGRIEAVNPAASTLFGYSALEIMGLGRDALVARGDRGMQRLLRERERRGWARDTVRYRRADLSEFTAEVASALFTDVDGKQKAVTVIHDITERLEHEERVRESEDRYRSLYEQSVDAIFIAQIGGRIFDCNPAAESLFGMSRDQICRLGGEELFDESDPALQTLRDEGKRHGHARCEVHMRRAGGERFLADVSVVSFRDMHGCQRNSVMVRDVTEQRRAEERMRLITAAFQSADECMLVCDERFHIRETNDAYLQTTGFDEKEAVGAVPSFLEFKQQARDIGRGLETTGHWRGELMQRRADGDLFVSQATVSAVEHYLPGINHVVVTFTDISGMRSMEERLEFLSLHDALTGLPNREALQKWFEEFMREDNGDLAILYFDLDRFKIINETYDHTVGDKLLQEVALSLKSARGPRDYAVSMGGDDFIIAVGGIESEEEAKGSAQYFLSAIEEPRDFGGRTLVCTASVGICRYPQDGRTLEVLLRGADAALHAAKLEGRRSVSAYKASMRESIERAGIVERELRHAVERDELRLEFQPVMSVPNRTCIGAEALVRWESPALGRVSPGEFIPVAEDTGLISDIGYWVVDAACREIKRLDTFAERLGYISVNVSTLQLRQSDLPERFAEILAAREVSPARMRLEITESVMMIDPDWAIGILERLRRRGFSIAIDDFGTGFSSLTYLRQLPAQYLKLDQSFTQRLPTSQVDLSIIQSVIELAHRLGIRVVAEGVETEEQFRVLSGWNCDEVQGYLFSRPSNATALRTLLASGRDQMPGN